MITKPLVIGKCPKCQGQLYLEKDFYGSYQSCIQCGYSKDLPDKIIQKVDKTDLLKIEAK